ncbi:MAG: diheme cytochrome c [Gammaproteobacteria bacterium]|nr:MAG: diheme cytochrome c [Gammaproteobacteria bacterium]
MKSALIVASMILVLGLVIVPIVWSDDDEYWAQYGRRSTDVALVPNPVYKDECGDCHMAYPPGLLPAKSWKIIMSGLEDHFGDNAELDTMTHKAITDFLMSNSADKSNYRRSRRFASLNDQGDIPIRISQTPYFKHEHDEIPVRVVTGNKEVNSFSYCNACHRKAEQASFRERDIFIPGYGQWDD